MEVSRFLRRKLRDMSAFEIVGGNALKGTVIPQGAKNEALQIISAVLLTAEPVIIRNIPEIIDVLKLIDLLQDIGVKVEARRGGGASVAELPHHQCLARSPSRAGWFSSPAYAFCQYT